MLLKEAGAGNRQGAECSGEGPSALGAGRRLLALGLALARTQCELLLLQAQAERDRVLRLLLSAARTLLLAFLAASLAVVALLLALEPPQRPWVAAALALALCLAALATVQDCRRLTRRQNGRSSAPRGLPAGPQDPAQDTAPRP